MPFARGQHNGAPLYFEANSLVTSLYLLLQFKLAQYEAPGSWLVDERRCQHPDARTSSQQRATETTAPTQRARSGREVNVTSVTDFRNKNCRRASGITLATVSLKHSGNVRRSSCSARSQRAWEQPKTQTSSSDPRRNSGPRCQLIKTSPEGPLCVQTALRVSPSGPNVHNAPPSSSGAATGVASRERRLGDGTKRNREVATVAPGGTRIVLALVLIGAWPCPFGARPRPGGPRSHHQRLADPGRPPRGAGGHAHPGRHARSRAGRRRGGRRRRRTGGPAHRQPRDRPRRLGLHGPARRHRRDAAGGGQAGPDEVLAAIQPSPASTSGCGSTATSATTPTPGARSAARPPT